MAALRWNYQACKTSADSGNRNSFNGRDKSPVINRVQTEKDIDFVPEQGVNKVTTGLAPRREAKKT